MHHSIETSNYYRDERNSSLPNSIITKENPDGTTYEVQLPTKWAVCDLCNGEGKHVNPSIDAGGLTNEDFYDDPDFLIDYQSGVYDIPCNHCHGRTTIRVVDEDAADPEDLKIYREQIEQDAYDRSVQLAELSMGA